MLFCQNGSSWTEVWVDSGINRCFFDSLSAGALCAILLFCGILQCVMYNRYSQRVDKKLIHRSCAVYFQVSLSLLLVVTSVVYMILQDVKLYDQILYGYQVLSACAFVLAYLVSLRLIFLDRSNMLPSIPTRGHGLVLLLFWALALVRENLAFVSWWSKEWWWYLKSESDYIELGFWIVRYACSLTLLVLGIPSSRHPHNLLPNDDSDDHGTERRRNASTWSNIMSKVKLLMPYVWPKGNVLLQVTVVFCLLILAVVRGINVFVPIYSKYIVNSLTLSPDASEEEELTYRWDLILTYTAFLFFKGGGTGLTGALNNLRSFLWIKVQQYTSRRIQVKLFGHLHSLSLRWHLQKKTGEVLRVVDRGTNSINNLLSYIVFQIVPTIADIVIAVVYFITAFNYLFGLIVFTSMVLYLTFTAVITEWRTKYRRSMNLLDNEANAMAVDSLLNFEMVKYYGASDFETERYNAAIGRYQTVEWKSMASLNLLNITQNVVTTIGCMAGALLCAWAVVHSVAGLTLTVGDYVLFGTYLSQLFVPLNFLGNYYRIIQQAFIDMEKMFDLLAEDAEIKDIPDASNIIVNQGKIEFQNVSFRYEPSKPILKNVSFVVQPGRTLALVGHTGSGKSTIIRLLFRFYDINSGVIRIDGKDISMMNQESLRKSIGVVPQDTVLFNTDIRYNIRYGKLGATDEEVDNAAQFAEIHDRILTFPKKYDTMVGERGLKLSGGEKQRVAIARTLLKAPAIVLLDEATSALDTKTERQIQKSLEQVCENRTTVIVAHRLSTIIHADQILVLSEGEVIERGTHEELLAKGEHYADMWQQQLQAVTHTMEPGVVDDVRRCCDCHPPGGTGKRVDVPLSETFTIGQRTVADCDLDVKGSDTDCPDWRVEQRKDAVVGEVIQHLQGQMAVKVRSTEAMQMLRSNLELKDGVLYRRQTEDGKAVLQLVVPSAHRKETLQGVHDDVGHLGVDRATELLRQRFFWPGMARDIKTHIQECGRCIRRKFLSSNAPLMSVKTSEPLELVCVDFLSLEPSRGSVENILVITDHFTKFAKAIFTPNQTATTTAKALYEHFFVHFGFPARIHSDQGRNFESKLIKELCEIAGVEKLRTTPYHPMGNGICERFNWTLLSLLGTLDPSQKANWKAHVPSLVLAYNCTQHDTTGYSPYFLMFGRHPCLPVDLRFGTQPHNGTDTKPYTEYVSDLQRRLKVAFDTAKQHADKSQLTQKQTYDRRLRGSDVQTGDRILVRNVIPQRKLDNRWSEEVYVVTAKPAEDAPVYRVIQKGRRGRPRTLHRNLLLPMGGGEKDATLTSEQHPQPKPIPHTDLCKTENEGKETDSEVLEASYHISHCISPETSPVSVRPTRERRPPTWMTTGDSYVNRHSAHTVRNLIDRWETHVTNF